jgi:hypothetical protein
MQPWLVGRRFRIVVEFKAGENPVNPDALELSIRAPDGSVEQLGAGQVIQDETGTYFYDLIPDQSGMWAFTWTGTGVPGDDGYQAVDESHLNVMATAS